MTLNCSPLLRAMGSLHLKLTDTACGLIKPFCQKHKSCFRFATSLCVCDGEQNKFIFESFLWWPAGGSTLPSFVVVQVLIKHLHISKPIKSKTANVSGLLHVRKCLKCGYFDESQPILLLMLSPLIRTKINNA